jgi:hypothetical protein
VRTTMVTREFVGICHMQVCADSEATDEAILEVCNRENPSGTTNGWSRVVRDAEGPQAPVQCHDDAKRTHFLVAC